MTRKKGDCFISLMRHFPNHFSIFAADTGIVFTMKKDVYVIPESKEILIRMEESILSGGEGGGGDDWGGEEG